MNGIILVDKPEGLSSFRIVSKIRAIISQEVGTKVKVGHTGTLDPMATGLMILVVGSYTKRATELSKLDKVYEAEIILGEVSTTGDREGELTFGSTRRPTKSELYLALKAHTGLIQQTPPIYSAIKVNGKRAYDLARKGKSVKLEPREVEVHSLELQSYKYPIIKLKAHVGSGTYIRSLAEDIGNSLKTGAYLAGLKRTKVGKYSLDKAVAIDKFKISDIIEM